VIGIEARTTNAKEATADGIIPRQWQRFFQEGILEKIPNKIGGNIYAVYSDYANDHNGEYDYVIGAMVKEGSVPPPGMFKFITPLWSAPMVYVPVNARACALCWGCALLVSSSPLVRLPAPSAVNLPTAAKVVEAAPPPVVIPLKANA